MANGKHKHTNWLLPNETCSHAHTLIQRATRLQRRQNPPKIFNCEMFTSIIRYLAFSHPVCDYLYCWCVLLSSRKKLSHLKSFKSSPSNKYVTNHVVFSSEEWGKKNEKFKWVYAKEAKERERKNCYASLIYRTSFKYFVSLSLHSNHPPNPKCDLYFSSLRVYTHTHLKYRARCFKFFFLLFAPWFRLFFLSLFCYAMLRCRFPARHSIYSLSFDIIYFTNSNLCNARRQNIESVSECATHTHTHKKSNLSFTVQ